MKEKAREDFNALLNGKLSDGKLTYNKSFKYEGGGVKVWLTPEAYKKIVALVTEFSDEIGWHGTVRRDNTEFIIENILVYPQEVTGSTVNTDQKLYTDWLYGLDDGTFNKIRMQGHSHCNMSVSPSGVDDRHRQSILEQLEEDMYYIFMVWNKSLSVHTLVYDMAKNILYENDDVEVILLGNCGMGEFLEEAKTKVKKAGPKRFHVKRKETEQVLVCDGDYENYHQYGMYELYTGGHSWGV